MDSGKVLEAELPVVLSPCGQDSVIVPLLVYDNPHRAAGSSLEPWGPVSFLSFMCRGG